MMRNAWKSKLVGLLTLGLLTACGGVQGPAYEGEPLASFKGHLIADGTLETQGEVRMALLWFPRGFTILPDSAPVGIVTQDVAYRGELPLSFSFDVNQPPPQAAIGELHNGGRGAVGVLVAYEDVNGNGMLDTVVHPEVPVDRVVGSAFNFFRPPYFMITYLAERAEGGDDRELGFNLLQWQIGSPDWSKVPLTTSIPIALSGLPFLNGHICDQQGNAVPITTTSGPCGVVLPAEDQKDIHVSGVLNLGIDSALVKLSVKKDGAVVEGTTVTIGDIAVPGDGMGGFELRDATRTLLAPGAVHTLKINVPGAPEVIENVRMPGDFQITPADGAVLPVGQKFSASWTAAPNAERYLAMFRPDFDFNVMGHSVDYVTTTFETPHVLDSAGNATFSVTARAQGSTTQRIETSFEKSIRVRFQ